MSPRRSRILLVVSVVALAAVAGTWAAWPESGSRADLAAVAPVATTTTTSPTTIATPGTSPGTLAPTVDVPAGAGDPVVVRVDAVGIDARVVPVALEPTGDMEIPPTTDVGWYRLGPLPGARGSSVLAAHVDYAGERGAFFELASVPIGAEVVVIDDTLAEQRFVVTEREQVAKDDVELERYFTDQGDPRLTLITCGGAFNPGVRSYDDNIIVTAVPV